MDGSDACDLFVVSRQEPMAVTRQDVRVKERKFVCYPEEGVCRLDLTGQDRTRPSLTAAQAVELARLAVAIEAHYGDPQDIEWAIDPQGTIFLLQCRPLQQKQAADAESPPDAHGPAPDSILCRGGITASPGAACGPVFIAEKAADVLAFPDKGVLVIRQALPRWASLLNRAAAVVSEQGGFAGHLANVAREFGVPALFGVADACSTDARRASSSPWTPAAARSTGAAWRSCSSRPLRARPSCRAARCTRFSPRPAG